MYISAHECSYMCMNVYVYEGPFAWPNQCMTLPVHEGTFAWTYLVHEHTNVILAYWGTSIFLINKWMTNTYWSLNSLSNYQVSKIIEKLTTNHYRALQYYPFFGILSGTKRRMIWYCKLNRFLIQAKRFKMCHFLSICVQSLQKVLLWPPQKFSLQNTIWVSKYAENCAAFKVVDKNFKECFKKKLCPNNYSNFEFCQFKAFLTLLLSTTFFR